MKIKYLMTFLTLFGVSAAGIAADESILPAVRVEKVSTIDQSEPRTYVGTVTASETVDLVARVNGVLWKAAYKEGALVKKGDLLFQIEDTIYKENVNAAKASLQQCMAELDYATKEFQRYSKLYKTNATAETTYENARREQQVCQAKVDAAKANLALAE